MSHSDNPTTPRLAPEVPKDLEDTVAHVASAIRRFATAASSHLGGDCFLHMEFARQLLLNAGIETTRVVGFAAWRVGQGDGDVIAHASDCRGYAPPGQDAFPYHAWPEYQSWVIDVTTYQLRIKARALDSADAGNTAVDWCPDYLLITREQVQTLQQVTAAPNAGIVYYEARPELMAALPSSDLSDPSDLATLRLLLANPQLSVFGPNDATTDGAMPRFTRLQPQPTMRTFAPDLEHYLKGHQVTLVRAEYGGSQGMGGFEALQFMRADGSPVLIRDGAFHLRLKGAFRALLMSRYPRWCLDDGSCGDFRWDLVVDLLTHTHYLRGSITERATHHNLST